ncbi:hypothetical protein [Staphylococcus massiliensis]|uniref:Uncharacterized protein n=1 Tax=Staphylococcus massiliensis S46 TaxID=1229783 RepID=K9AUV7_9STAP|nr:hypothetical protein [Staphylococcus massiliensis]EKU49841.1 hypothetical protein C273_03065 [Staphylococcus massiliensis S46]MCG3398945.1 hypothetical protein [Staphylococcus massiliensis]MCG3412994.1 hypothetical protein [Staphylococcus massiliensis]POA02067.1 hypothetical protein CD133_00255 [Staphylococcus massiliensis CCUG 55927]
MYFPKFNKIQWVGLVLLIIALIILIIQNVMFLTGATNDSSFLFTIGLILGGLPLFIKSDKISIVLNLLACIFMVAHIILLFM